MADNNSGSNNTFVFIIGGLVVAVAVIGWYVYNDGMFYRGGMPGENRMDVTIEAPAPSDAPNITIEAPAPSDAPST